MAQDVSSKLTATFHLTHDCNLRCRYCYTGEKIGRHMTTAVSEQAIQVCLSEAKRQKATHLEIIFFGGEPLMRLEMLCEIADRFHTLRGALTVSFKLSTNGLLLTEKARDALSRRKIYVSVSLDGDPETQEHQRPTPNGHSYAEQLVRMIPDWLAWNPCMNVTTVVTPEVAGRVDESISWLVDRGFSYISVALDFSANWTLESMNVLKAGLERLGQRYIEWHERGRKVFVSCFDSRIQSHIRTREQQCACSFGKREFSIAPSGRLYPCVQFVGDDPEDSEHVIGTVASGFDERARELLITKAAQEKSECEGCALDSRCTKWCACINWTDTGDIERASPTLCHYEKMLIPIADRVARHLYRSKNPEFLHKHYNPDYPVLNFLESLVIEKADEID